MRHSWGRWSLAVVLIAGAAGACAWAVQLEGQLRAVRQTAATAATHAGNARAALGDVRRAVAAMASPGQAAVGWSRRASAGIDDARAQLKALAAVVPLAAAPRTALDVFERLGEAERRLRDHAVGGKPLMAADVAFAEAAPHLDDLERQIADALAAATAAADRTVATLRDRQAAALAAALAGLAIGVLMLAPLRRADVAAPDASVAAMGASPSPLPDLPGVPASELERAPVPAAPAVDLQALASVCGELAQLSDAAALPATLERLASAIGARGLILWLGDRERRTLQVAATAGYDARLIERFGQVNVDDDNPTAHAWATGRPVVTDARQGRAAAAMPIVGPAGTIGVLSMELLADDAAGIAASTAAAQVAAAQLSQLVGPSTPGAATPADDVPAANAHGGPR